MQPPSLPVSSTLGVALQPPSLPTLHFHIINVMCGAADYSFLRQLAVSSNSFLQQFSVSSASCVALQFLQFRAADYSFLGLQYCRLRVWRCSFAAVSLQFRAADYSFLSLQHRRLRMWRCSFAAVSFMLSDFVCGATIYMCGTTVYSFLSLQYRIPYSFLLYFVSTVVYNIACSIAFSSGTGFVICGMAAVAVCGALSMHGVSVLWFCSL